MRLRNFLLFTIATAATLSCKKGNDMSKVPQIGLSSFGPEYVRVNKDTLVIVFGLQDGDGDLGRGKGDIFIHDFRYPGQIDSFNFPDIDPTVVDPTKGLVGDCAFLYTPALLTPRSDSLHIATGDTTYFELYIKDKAGNESNHITTPYVIMTVK